VWLSFGVRNFFRQLRATRANADCRSRAFAPPGFDLGLWKWQAAWFGGGNEHREKIPVPSGGSEQALVLIEARRQEGPIPTSLTPAAK
jgi:hypothetical protein